MSQWVVVRKIREKNTKATGKIQGSNTKNSSQKQNNNIHRLLGKKLLLKFQKL